MEQVQQDRVAVIDEDPACRAGYSVLIESMGILCREYASAEDFLTRENTSQLACVVIENALPGLQGLELLKRLKSQAEHLPVVVVAKFVTVTLAVRLMQCGAFMVLRKPYQAQELANVIREAVASDRDRRARQTRIKGWRVALETLTDEERQVVQGIAAGTPNAELAQRLNIGLRTVEKRRKRVFDKLSIDSLPALIEIIFYAESKLLRKPRD